MGGGQEETKDEKGPGPEFSYDAYTWGKRYSWNNFKIRLTSCCQQVSQVVTLDEGSVSNVKWTRRMWH